MRKLFFSLCAIQALLLGTSCDEVIEKDLEGEEFSVVTPPSDFISTESAINFFWNETVGALAYRLQIGRPDLTSPVEIVIDSLYSGNSAQVILEPGGYEWRMRAENPNSFTDYQYGTVAVDSSGSLQGINMTLISPLDGEFLNENTVTLEWAKIPSAVEYWVDVTDGQAFDVTYILETSIYELDIAAEGDYIWSVQAINDFSVSNSAGRTFSIDQTAPPIVTLLNPLDNSDFFELQVDFTWIIPEDVGGFPSPRVYDLEISSDSLFDDLLFGTPVETDSDSVRTALEIGTFYWRVGSADAAGNFGGYSETRQLEVFP